MKQTKKPPKPHPYLEPALAWTEFSENIRVNLWSWKKCQSNESLLRPMVQNLRESAEKYLDSCGWKVIALCQMEGNPDPIDVWNKLSKIVRCRLEGKDPDDNDLVVAAPDLETEVTAMIVQDCIRALMLYCRTMQMIQALEHRDAGRSEMNRTYTVRCSKIFPGLASAENPRKKGRVKPGKYADTNKK